MNNELPQETLEQFEQALENGATIDELRTVLINNRIRWNGDSTNLHLDKTIIDN
jgi:hypothetical protein